MADDLLTRHVTEATWEELKTAKEQGGRADRGDPAILSESASAGEVHANPEQTRMGFSPGDPKTKEWLRCKVESLRISLSTRQAAILDITTQLFDRFMATVCRHDALYADSRPPHLLHDVKLNVLRDYRKRVLLNQLILLSCYTLADRHENLQAENPLTIFQAWQQRIPSDSGSECIRRAGDPVSVSGGGFIDESRHPRGKSRDAAAGSAIHFAPEIPADQPLPNLRDLWQGGRNDKVIVKIARKLENRILSSVRSIVAVPPLSSLIESTLSPRYPIDFPVFADKAVPSFQSGSPRRLQPKGETLSLSMTAASQPSLPCAEKSGQNSQSQERIFSGEGVTRRSQFSTHGDFAGESSVQGEERQKAVGPSAEAQLLLRLVRAHPTLGLQWPPSVQVTAIACLSGDRIVRRSVRWHAGKTLQ